MKNAERSRIVELQQKGYGYKKIATISRNISLSICSIKSSARLVAEFCVCNLIFLLSRKVFHFLCIFLRLAYSCTVFPYIYFTLSR